MAISKNDYAPVIAEVKKAVQSSLAIAKLTTPVTLDGRNTAVYTYEVAGADFVAEGAEKPVVQSTLKTETLYAEVIAALNPISNQSWASMTPDALESLITKTTNEIIKKIDSAVFYGTTLPSGVRFDTLSAATAVEVSDADDVLDALAALGDNGQEVKIGLSKTAMSKLRRFRNAAGFPLLEIVEDRGTGTGTIEGYEFAYVNTGAAGDLFIAGNYADSATLGLGDVDVQTSTDAGFTTNQTMLRIEEYVGFRADVARFKKLTFVAGE